MTYASIAVHVDSKAGKRVGLAMDLARRHNAALTGVAAGMWQPPVALVGPDAFAISADIIEAGRQQVEAELAEAKALFERLTVGAGVKTAWRSASVFPHAELAAAANGVDLLVVGPCASFTVGGDYREPNPADVIMAAGRPVLVVPAEAERCDAGSIVVAWKNTREARRAVADALPALQRATAVTLLQVAEEGGETATIADAGAFLSRHGVEAAIESGERGAHSVEAALLGRAKDLGADLIVCGAYGRSRLREWAFGGVTRGLLAQGSVACQFSH